MPLFHIFFRIETFHPAAWNFVAKIELRAVESYKVENPLILNILKDHNQLC